MVLYVRTIDEVRSVGADLVVPASAPSRLRTRTGIACGQTFFDPDGYRIVIAARVDMVTHTSGRRRTIGAGHRC